MRDRSSSESEEDDRIKKKWQEKERRKEEDKAKKAELQSLLGGPDLLSASPTGLPEEAGFGAYTNPAGEDSLDIWHPRVSSCKRSATVRAEPHGYATGRRHRKLRSGQCGIWRRGSCGGGTIAAPIAFVPPTQPISCFFGRRCP